MSGIQVGKMSKNVSPHKKKVSQQECADVVISKIIFHSRNGVSSKLLKYLLHAKRMFTSSDLRLWMELRKKGGLEAIQTVVRTLIVEAESTNTTTEATKNDLIGKAMMTKEVQKKGAKTDGSSFCSCKFKLSSVQKDVCVASLSILGNAFSLDYAARKEVASNGFTEVLHKFIQKYLRYPPTSELAAPSSSESLLGTSHSSGGAKKSSMEGCDRCMKLEEITTRVVKCVANLAHDAMCREVVLKSGVGISILKIVEAYNEDFGKPRKTEEQQQMIARMQVSSQESRAKKTLNEGHRECIRSCIRAIRILSSEPFCSEEARVHLIRFGSVISIGKVLTWCCMEDTGQDLILDIVRALISLTERIKLLPTDQIEVLVYEDSHNEMLLKLVELFKDSDPDQKLFYPLVRCLNNLSGNTRIAETFGRLHIFRVALEKLKSSPVKASSEICRLLVTLTKHSSENQCVLHNCQEICSTMEILRSSELPEFHRWILHVYENVYERSLKSLLQNGLIDLIHIHMKEELEECDYEMLKRKIMSMEDDSCQVHKDVNGCSFAPVYRCDSPLYQQVQEEVKILLKGRESHNKMDTESGSSGIESSSPSNSPARSWTSEDSSLGDFNSPRRVRSPSSSEDEGCYSPVYSFTSSSPSYSAQGSPGMDCEMSEDDEVTHQAKRIKLDLDENEATEEQQRSGLPKHPLYQSHGKLSTENLKTKSKKIVSMLNILHKCTHLSPMSMGLVQVVPILLSFLVRGIVSLTPQKDNYDQPQGDEECTSLGRQSFSLAYRILNTMCLNINMFPDFLKNGTIVIVNRLLAWDKLLEKLGGTQSVRSLLDTLGGENNKTAGWRFGFLLRTLMISKSEEELNNISILVPLLFRKNDHVLRKFESQGHSWSRVFEMLSKSDDIGFSRFQDCIYSISKLCETIGMKWTDSDDAGNRPLLWKSRTENMKELFAAEEESASMTPQRVHGQKVEVILDDGTHIKISKDILTQASPVFSAMFNGHFVEAGQQKVRIPDTSSDAIKSLTEQIFLQNQSTTGADHGNVLTMEYDMYSLSTLFELVSLSDRFLLEGIYERTLNTLLRFYICPYSAPIIYEEAVKLSGLLKPHNVQGGCFDLTFVVLKYLLVGDLSMSCKCVAFRKIFETVSPSIVVGDMRALVEYYSSRPQR